MIIHLHINKGIIWSKLEHWDVFQLDVRVYFASDHVFEATSAPLSVAHINCKRNLTMVLVHFNLVNHGCFRMSSWNEADINEINHT